MILGLEYGKEALIPKELSQDHLPQSFRYYDSLQKIIHQHITASIGPQESKHEIQRSRYVSVDGDVKYLNPEEVNKKRQNIMNFK